MFLFCQKRCDGGTNFIGNDHELKEGLKIHTRLLEDNCERIDFMFVPSSGSHIGGNDRYGRFEKLLHPCWKNQEVS